MDPAENPPGNMGQCQSAPDTQRPESSRRAADTQRPESSRRRMMMDPVFRREEAANEQAAADDGMGEDMRARLQRVLEEDPLPAFIDTEFHYPYRRLPNWRPNDEPGPSHQRAVKRRKYTTDPEPKVEIKEEDQIDLRSELENGLIRRIIGKCPKDDFFAMELTCKEFKHLVDIDQYWRELHARGILYKEGVIEVMVCPYKETHRSLQEVTAEHWSVIAPYVCLTGNLDEDVFAKVTDALRKNKCKIDRIVINPISWGNGRSQMEVAPEIITKLAEACGATKLVVCTNTDTRVELLTTKRQSNFIKSLHLGPSLPISKYQLERQTFHTLIAKHVQNPLNPTCIIPLIKEWFQNKRVIRFIQLGLAQPNIDPLEAQDLMAGDIHITGGPIWSSYYNRESVHQFLPLTWSSPNTANKGWIFFNENATESDQGVLLAFFLEGKLTVGSVEGLKENKKYLPWDVLHERPLVGGGGATAIEDYHSDLTERNNTRSQADMFGLMRDHRHLRHFPFHQLVPNADMSIWDMISYGINAVTSFLGRYLSFLRPLCNFVTDDGDADSLRRLPPICDMCRFLYSTRRPGQPVRVFFPCRDNNCALSRLRRGCLWDPHDLLADMEAEEEALWSTRPRQPNEQRRLRRRWLLQEVDREGAATRQRRQEVQPQAEEEHPVDLDESIQDSTDDEGEADEQEHEWSAMAAELSDQPGPSSARP